MAYARDYRVRREPGHRDLLCDRAHSARGGRSFLLDPAPDLAAECSVQRGTGIADLPLAGSIIAAGSDDEDVQTSCIRRRDPSMRTPIR